MQKEITGPFSTTVYLDDDEAENICLLGKGAECCAFLACGTYGFECLRMSYPLSGIIFSKLESGAMERSLGGWEGCAWEDR